MNYEKRISDDDISKIAVAAEAHERTVMRRLLGLPVRGHVAKRVDRLLAAWMMEDSEATAKAAP